MTPRPSPNALTGKRKLVLGSLVFLAALVALFDWNWFRRPLINYFAEKSQREIRVDDLHVEMGFSLEPTIRLRGVYIENAPWAEKRPFATAAEASFTVSLRSLWQGRPIISRLVLVDADVDMERQADGLRNWRLRHPDERAPSRVKVLTLEAHRTQIRFVNREIDLELVAVSSPVEKDPEGLSMRIAFKGTYESVPFSGEALCEGVLSFRESGVTFPLRGHMVSRSVRLDLDGLFTDLFDIGPFDAKVRLAGATLSQLHPFLRIHPPPSRAFDLEAQLTQTHDIYEFADLKGRVGETDLAGDATYDRSGERPRVRAALRSQTAHVADLRSLVGMRPSPKNGSRESASGDERVFPVRPLRVERLNAFDAHLTLDAKQLRGGDLPFDSLRVAAELANGVLELKPVDLGIAGGHIAGTLRLDARREPPSAAASLELRGLKLEKLLDGFAARSRSSGAIAGRIKLAGQGPSVAAMLGNAAGSFSVHMPGGTISNIADAKLALNFGKLLGLALRGDRDIAIGCAAAAFDVRGGIARARGIVLDTEQTHTAGTGTIDLRKERWDLLLTPQPKKRGLLTKRASIRVDGPLRRPDFSVQERVAIGRDGSTPSTESAASSAGTANGSEPCGLT